MRWEFINLSLVGRDHILWLRIEARLNSFRMVGAQTSSTERLRPVGTPKMDTKGTTAVEDHITGIDERRLGGTIRLLFGTE